jgi:hypothetical protein
MLIPLKSSRSKPQRQGSAPQARFLFRRRFALDQSWAFRRDPRNASFVTDWNALSAHFFARNALLRASANFELNNHQHQLERLIPKWVEA